MMVTVYSKPACVQCTAVKNWLKRREIPFTEIDVTTDDEALAKVLGWGYAVAPVTSVQAHPSYPVDHVGGFDPDRLAALTAA